MINESTIENILKECGVELYDTEIVTENDKKIYRIYITSKDGITLDKCAEVTRILSPILDVEAPVSGRYTLEVSSPGIERPIENMKHFKASIGELVKIKLINTDKIEGKLIGVEGGKITILEDDEEKTTVDFEDIEKARTYYEW